MPVQNSEILKTISSIAGYSCGCSTNPDTQRLHWRYCKEHFASSLSNMMGCSFEKTKQERHVLCGVCGPFKWKEIPYFTGARQMLSIYQLTQTRPAEAPRLVLSRAVLLGPMHCWTQVGRFWKHFQNRRINNFYFSFEFITVPVESGSSQSFRQEKAEVLSFQLQMKAKPYSVQARILCHLKLLMHLHQWNKGNPKADWPSMENQWAITLTDNSGYRIPATGNKSLHLSLSF